VPFFYADSLRKRGHEANEIYVNNEYMQKAWAKEHGVHEVSRWEFRLRRGILPWISRVKERWLYDILAAQIRYYKPDVLYNQAMDTVSGRFLKKIKRNVGLWIGAHAASPRTNGEDFRCYGIFVSSFPPTLEQFRRKRIPAELLRLGFGSECLSCMDGEQRPFDLTFVGNLYPIHSSRIA